MARTALQKLQDASVAIDQLEATQSLDEAEILFEQAVSALKAAFEKIPAETLAQMKGKENANSSRARIREWNAEIKRSAREDELVEWMFSARDSGHHGIEGEQGFSASSTIHINHYETPEPGSQPPGTTGTLESDGAWIYYNPGTPFERRERYPADVSWKLTTRLVNPPKTHRNEPLGEVGAVEALRLTHAFIVEIWQHSRDISRILGANNVSGLKGDS